MYEERTGVRAGFTAEVHRLEAHGGLGSIGDPKNTERQQMLANEAGGGEEGRVRPSHPPLGPPALAGGRGRPHVRRAHHAEWKETGMGLTSQGTTM